MSRRTSTAPLLGGLGTPPLGTPSPMEFEKIPEEVGTQCLGYREFVDSGILRAAIAWRRPEERGAPLLDPRDDGRRIWKTQTGKGDATS